MELILAIAALCEIAGGAGSATSPERTRDYQAECQAFYSKCVREVGKPLDAPEGKLLICMEKRVKEAK